MGTSSTVPISPGAAFRQNWVWLLILGVLSIILGIIAVVDAIWVTIISMIFFGWVLVVGGIIEAAQAFRHRHTGHMLVHVLNAVLSLVVGAMLLLYPVAGALTLTLLLAAYFTVIGIFRIVAALQLHHPQWGWALLHGVITLILGILVGAQWPSSALWIIGFFIGIHLIFTGWAEVMLALGTRSLP